MLSSSRPPSSTPPGPSGPSSTGPSNGESSAPPDPPPPRHAPRQHPLSQCSLVPVDEQAAWRPAAWSPACSAAMSGWRQRWRLLARTASPSGWRGRCTRSLSFANGASLHAVECGSRAAQSARQGSSIGLATRLLIHSRRWSACRGAGGRGVSRGLVGRCLRVLVGGSGGRRLALRSTRV
jgi:hypothetical protein